jgi:hypothetical protein
MTNDSFHHAGVGLSELLLSIVLIMLVYVALVVGMFWIAK